jgi:hypothetical protein
MGYPSFQASSQVGNQPNTKESPMRNIKLSKTIILTSAIALGCVSVTADAFARGGVGGAAAGHAAASGGVAGGHAAASGGHASAVSRGAPASGVGHSHFDGSSFFHVSHGFAVD